MAAVDTNSISLALCKETTSGKLPGSGTKAVYLEPNGIPDFGGSISTVARSPISANRQQRKGTITDFSSTVSVEQDLTVSSFLAVIDGAVLSEWQGVPTMFNAETTSSGLTVATLATAIPANSLVYMSGFKNNLGVKKVTTAANKGGTSLAITGLTAGDTGTAFLCGYEGTAGDISSGTNQLLSTTLDFTTLPLVKGQAIYVGGETASTSFSSGGISGLARIVKIEAHTLTLDKLEGTFKEDSGDGKSIRIFFGPFLRNVPVNDELFNAHSYAMELTYPGLVDKDNGIFADGYEYSTGNKINTIELGMSVNDKATLNFTTFGLDTHPVSETSQGWDISNPTFVEAFSTPSDFLRLRVQGADEEGLTSYFKDCTLSLNNNISAENVLAKLGPAFTNIGTLSVSLSGNIVFTNPKVTEKIRNNCTCSADICLSNNDGSIYIDLPRITLGDGSKDFAVNEKVKLSLTGTSFVDDEYDYSVGITYFPYLPTVKSATC